MGLWAGESGKVLDDVYEALALAPETAGTQGLASRERCPGTSTQGWVDRDSYPQLASRDWDLGTGTQGLVSTVPAAAPGPAHGTAACQEKWNS